MSCLQKTSYDFLVHESCKSKTYLDKVIPVYSYNDVAKLVVQKIKFEFDKEFGKVIAQQILKSESVKSLLNINAVLIPVLCLNPEKSGEDLIKVKSLFKN